MRDFCCGSGGFLLYAQDFIVENYNLDREQKEFLKSEAFYGNEIVANTFKLCLMNLYLHNIGDIYGIINLLLVLLKILVPKFAKIIKKD